MIPDFLENKIERKNANYHLQDTLENFLLAADSIRQLPLDYLNVELKIEKSTKGDKYMIKSNGHPHKPDSGVLRQEIRFAKINELFIVQLFAG